MAGPGIPTNRTTASTIAEHVSDHNTMATYIDELDTTFLSGGNDGDVLTLDIAGGTWKPGRGVPFFNAKSYGATGDGSTDDTTALQSFITAVVAAKGWGVIPAGTYKITAKLDVPQNFGWKIQGVGPEATILKQYTNNIPILDVGPTGSAEVHSWEISDLQFTYNASQSTANTNAICIKFSAMGYEGRILRCNFKHGFRGVSVASGVVGWWGCTLDDLGFDAGLTGSAISFADASVAGVPNNHFVRMLVSATNMVGPVFWLNGETSKIGTIEVINASQGPRIMELASGSTFDIDQIKLEVGTYNASQSGLFYMAGNAAARVGYLRFHDLTVNGSSIVHLVNIQPQAGTDTTGSLHIGKLEGKATFNTTAKGYGVQAAASTIIEEVHLYKLGGTSSETWRLQDHGGSDTADQVQIPGHNRQRVSANLGNADYVIVHGVAGSIPSPNILFFETAFTAQRTVDLPSNGDDLWNGLTYKIIARNGAINGANTLRIRVGATILRTQSTDNVALTYVYRRQSSGAVDANWKLVDVSSLA